MDKLSLLEAEVAELKLHGSHNQKTHGRRGGKGGGGLMAKGRVSPSQLKAAISADAKRTAEIGRSKSPGMKDDRGRPTVSRPFAGVQVSAAKASQKKYGVKFTMATHKKVEKLYKQALAGHRDFSSNPAIVRQFMASKTMQYKHVRGLYDMVAQYGPKALD